MNISEIIIWFILSLLVSLYASSKKGRSGFVFFIISILLSPIIGFIMALIISPNIDVIEGNILKKGMHKKCPQCAELVKKEASICKYCGSDITGFNFDDLPDINIVTNSKMKNEQDWNSN